MTRRTLAGNWTPHLPPGPLPFLHGALEGGGAWPAREHVGTPSRNGHTGTGRAQ